MYIVYNTCWSIPVVVMNKCGDRITLSFLVWKSMEHGPSACEWIVPGTIGVDDD